MMGCSKDENPADDVDPVVDEDNDGYPSTEDCDDGDSSVNPGAPETCDGKDNDCDDIIDEDATDVRPFFKDGDGDAYGDPMN